MKVSGQLNFHYEHINFGLEKNPGVTGIEPVTFGAPTA
jgi:hypothetical protein